MRLKFSDLINYAVVFIVFSDAFDLPKALSFADMRFSYLIIFFVLLLWFPLLRNIYFNKTFLFLFCTMIIFSLYNVYIGKDTLTLLAKQVLGILASSLVFYLLIKINNYNLQKLFRIYLNIAFLVGLIGLLQELSYLLDFKIGYDFSYMLPSWQLYISENNLLKINSILPEPSFFACSMMPAFFAAITSCTKSNFRFLKKWKSWVIISSLFLSFSATAYIGMFFSLLLLLYNSYRKIRYMLAGIAAICVLTFFLYNNVGDFKTRVDDSINVVTKKASLESTNLSTFALFSNALVAYNSFKNSFIFGSGLGSHEISYNEYIKKVVDVDKVIMFLNKGDANSLFLRLLSETGLLGLLAIIIFILKFHLVRKNDDTGYLWIINNAVLAMFVIRLLRFGHYFATGFFFFFWLYYFSKIDLGGRKIRK